VPCAALCYRKTPSVAFALLASFIANVAYANGIVQGESIRWVSALVGLAGAYEFGRGSERTKQRKPVSIPDALRKVDAGTWIGLVALASMGVDGLGLILYREFGVWAVPEMTTCILCLLMLLGVRGKIEVPK
jgi:hypothetical protein